MSLHKLAVSSVKWNTVSTVVTILVQFTTLAILAHLLSPADFGLMGMALVVTGIAGILSDLGLNNAIIYRQDASQTQLSSLYWLNIIVSWTLWLLLWIGAPLAALFFNQEIITEVLRGASISFIILPFGQQFQAILRRELQFDKIGCIRIAEFFAYGLVAIILAILNFGVMSIVYATVVRSGVSTSFAIYIASKKQWIPKLHFRMGELQGFVRFGLFQLGDRIVSYLGNNIDYLIIGRFLGAEALGYYTLAYNLMRVPQLTINPIIVSVAFPTFARIQNQDEVMCKGYGKILHYLSLVVLPMMTGMLLVAPMFVPIVYGESWHPAISVVQIFCLLGIVKSLGNPLGSVLLAKGRADLGFYMNSIAIIGYTLSNLIGLQWGIIGVAWSSFGFTLFVLMPIDFYLRRQIIGMKAKEFWSAIQKPTWAALTMMVALLIVSSSIGIMVSELFFLFFLIVFGVLIYLFAIWYFDKVFVESILKEFLQR